MTSDDMRAELAAQFAVAAGGHPLQLSPALRESIVVAGRLDGELPPVLTEHYAGKMPAERIAQLELPLLHRKLELARLPHLREALDGAFAALRAAALDPVRLYGHATAAELVAARPTLAALYAPTLFASGVPMLGAYRPEVARLNDELAAGADPDALIDLRLSGQIVHELCHGPQYETDAPPPPWMIVESGVVHLCRVARERHVAPLEPGEAVAAVGLFAQLGGALARRFGNRALWRILGEPDAFVGELGARTAALLGIAGWQEWQRRRAPPFARDALDAMAWVKLADSGDRFAGVEDRELVEAARTLPDLLDTARGIAWQELPWWSERADARDDEFVAVGVRSLFAVHRLGRTFETVPDELPEGQLLLDVERCELRAHARAHGVYAEPAFAIFPPPLARALHARGARRIVVDHATRDASVLLDLCHGSSPLAAELRL